MTEQTETFPWLTSEYIKTILMKTQGHEKLELIDYKIAAGSAIGENYAGVILRARINFSINGIEKSTRFILKAAPADGILSEMFESFDVFEGEKFVYEKIHKYGEDLLPDFKIAPRYNASFVDNIFCFSL